MALNKDTFADSELAMNTARELYPDASRVSLVSHGYDNLVVLVDQTYALRFPRTVGALHRGRYEKQVLTDLEDIKNIVIPKVLGEHDDPPCLITTCLSGQHVGSGDIRSWSTEKQVDFGEQTARFAYQMHTLLSIEKARKLRKELKLDEQQEEPWDIHFAKLFRLDVLTAEQNMIAQQYYEEWKELRTNPDVVLHDDLHTENMLFQEGRLTGILDFGDTNIGSPEQELRQLYRINDTVLNAAVNTYEQLSGQTINVRAIQVWAVMQELSAYIERLASDKVQHHAFGRASSNLNRWLSTDIWGKGQVATDTPRRQ